MEGWWTKEPGGQAQCLVSMVTPERIHSGPVTSLEDELLDTRDPDYKPLPHHVNKQQSGGIH